MKRFIGILCAAVCAAASAAHGQTVASQLVASGFTRPVWVTAPRGDFNRLFVLEDHYRAVTTDPWSGRIKVIHLPGNTVDPTIYLSISGVANTGAGVYIDEQGLLGLAFHPDFLNNGYFYVHHTRGSDSAVLIERYRANPPYATSTTADPNSVLTLITLAHPQTNHNAGWMSFGVDGYLYIAVGDGGNGQDTGTGHSPIGNAQDLTSPLGKILRIDVNGPDGIPGTADDADPATGLPYRVPPTNPFSGTGQRREIFNYGLRNPWRDDFDPLTHDLWIADVGQDTREEINVSIGNPPAQNFGWKCEEGFFCTGYPNCPTCPSIVPGTHQPIMDYANAPNTPIAPLTNFNGCAIIGGMIYRGCAMPWLQGSYFFSDNCTPRIFSLRYDGSAITEIVERTGELGSFTNISSFGRDAAGELYICSMPSTSNGLVQKIVPGTAVPNCHQICGSADFNCDGDVGTDADIEAFFACLAGNCPAAPCYNSADFNGDGDVGTDADIEAFFRVLGGGAC